MAIGEAPPFGRGETSGNTTATDLTQYEGKEYVFEDVDYSQSGIKPARSNRLVFTRLVRNTSGAALLPRRLVTFEVTAGADLVQQVDGYARTVAVQVAGVVDEWLPAAGVANGDLFHMVIRGPSEVLTALPADATNLISAGTFLVAATGITSGATTAGRVMPQEFLSITATSTGYTLAASMARNVIGKALSARTTTNTGFVLLADIQVWANN